MCDRLVHRPTRSPPLERPPNVSPSPADPPSDLAPESRAIFAMADELGLLDHDTSTGKGPPPAGRAERSVVGGPLTVGSVEDREIQSTRGSLRTRAGRCTQRASLSTALSQSAPC